MAFVAAWPPDSRGFSPIGRGISVPHLQRERESLASFSAECKDFELLVWERRSGAGRCDEMSGREGEAADMVWQRDGLMRFVVSRRLSVVSVVLSSHQKNSKPVLQRLSSENITVRVISHKIE